MSSGGAPKKHLAVWIGGTVAAFWIILVSLFFISHLATSGSRHAAAAAIRHQSVSFSLLPTQGRLFNVSLLFPWVASVGWHRTCCWHRDKELHCDGAGAFSVHVDKRENVLVVRIIQAELIGAQCTFHAWATNDATNTGGVGHHH